MRTLHPDVAAAVQARVLFSRAEEEILEKVSSVSFGSGTEDLVNLPCPYL